MKLNPEERIINARMNLSRVVPFFSHLVSISHIEIGPTKFNTAQVELTSTGSIKIVISPKFLKSISDPELGFLILHEILHIALRHPQRLGERIPMIWNFAGDYLINHMANTLCKGKLKMPEGLLYDEKYKEMTTEEVYDLIYKEMDDESKKQGTSLEELSKEKSIEVKSDSMGDPSDVDSGGKETEYEMSNSVEMAAKAALKETEMNMGNSSADIMRSLELYPHDSKIPWQEVLEEFVKNTVPEFEMTYTKPNSRNQDDDIILPSYRGREEHCLKAAISIDTSGSMSRNMLGDALNEVLNIAEAFSTHDITMLSCDSTVTKSGKFDKDVLDNLELTGGGGTDMNPVIDYVNNVDDPDLVDIDCLIIITDGYCPPINEIMMQPAEVIIISIDSMDFETRYTKILAEAA